MYHLHFKNISASNGQSITAAMAYRFGTKIVQQNKIVDENGIEVVQEKSHDYTAKKDVIFTKVFAPADAPNFVHDIEKLTQFIEIKESRKNARYAKECEIALPYELPLEEQKKLIAEFIGNTFIKEKLVVMAAIHHEENSRNIHAHIAIYDRPVNNFEFNATKDSDINEVAYLRQVRKEFADLCNKYLAKNGYTKQVTHKSFKTLGIELEATKKIGYSDKSIIENAEIAARNLVRIQEKPAIFIELIKSRYVEFSKNDIQGELVRLFEIFQNGADGSDDSAGKIPGELVERFDSKFQADLYKVIEEEVIKQQRDNRLFFRMKEGEVFFFALDKAKEEADSSTPTAVVDKVKIIELGLAKDGKIGDKIEYIVEKGIDKVVGNIVNYIGKSKMKTPQYDYEKVVAEIHKNPARYLPIARVVSGKMGQKNAKYEIGKGSDTAKYGLWNKTAICWTTGERFKLVDFAARMNGYEDNISFLNERMSFLGEAGGLGATDSVSKRVWGGAQSFAEKLDGYVERLGDLEGINKVGAIEFLQLATSLNLMKSDTKIQDGLIFKIEQFYRNGATLAKEMSEFKENQKSFELIAEYGKGVLASNVALKEKVSRYLAGRGYGNEQVSAMLGKFGVIDNIDKLRGYLVENGTSEEVVGRLNLSYRHEKSLALILPYESAGGVLGLVAVNLERELNDLPKYQYYSGSKKSWGLLGSNQFDKNEPITLVEGVFDAVALQANGVANIYASGGTSLSDNQLLELKKLLDENGQKLILAMDNDGAGRNGNLNIAKQLLSFGIVPKIAIPSLKDLDEVVVKEGVGAARGQLAGAVTIDNYVTEYLQREFSDRDLSASEVQKQLAEKLEIVNDIIRFVDERRVFNYAIGQDVASIAEFIAQNKEQGFGANINVDKEKLEVTEVAGLANNIGIVEPIGINETKVTQKSGNALIDASIGRIIDHIAKTDGVMFADDLKLVIKQNISSEQIRFKHDLEDLIFAKDFIEVGGDNEQLVEKCFIEKSKLLKSETGALIKLVIDKFGKGIDQEGLEFDIKEAKHYARSLNDGYGELFKEKWGQQLTAIKREAVKALAKQGAIWNEAEIKAAIANNDKIKSIQEMAAVDVDHIVDFTMKQALAEGSIIELERKSLGGKQLYSSAQNLQHEKELHEDARKLTNIKFKINHNKLQSFFDEMVLDNRTLNESQKGAIKYICQEDGLSIIRGNAGVGKTTMLKYLKSYVEQESNKKILGLSSYGIAASGIEADANIESRTIASFLKSLNEGYDFKLKAGDIVVIDEAGVASTQDLHKIFSFALDYKLKLVCIGDENQAQPISSAQSFAVMMQNHKYYELNNIVRQKNPDHREAIGLMSEGMFDKGMKLFNRGGIFEFVSDKDKYQETVKGYMLDKYESKVMLATTNAEVDELNNLARHYLIEFGIINEKSAVIVNIADRDQYMKTKAKAFAVGEKIIFLKNDHKLKVKNGLFGTIKQINNKSALIAIDGQDRDVIIEYATYNNIDSGYADSYNNIDRGYASTVSKSQGVTVDSTHFLVGSYLDAHLALVGMSRHRDSLRVVVNEKYYQNIDKLALKIGNERRKLSALAFDMNEGELMKRDSNYRDLKAYVDLLHASEREGEMEEDIRQMYYERVKLAYKLSHKLEEIRNYLSELPASIQRKFRTEAGMLNIMNEVKHHEVALIKSYLNEKDPALRAEYADSLVQGRAIYKRFYDKEFIASKLTPRDLINDAQVFETVGNNNFARLFAQSSNRQFYVKDLENELRTSFLKQAQNMALGLDYYIHAQNNIAYGDAIIKEQQKEIDLRGLKLNIKRERSLSGIDSASEIKALEAEITARKTELQAKYIDDPIRAQFMSYCDKFKQRAGRFAGNEYDHKQLEKSIDFVAKNEFENQLALKLFGIEKINNFKNESVYRKQLPELVDKYKQLATKIEEDLLCYVNIKKLEGRLTLIQEHLSNPSLELKESKSFLTKQYEQVLAEKKGLEAIQADLGKDNGNEEFIKDFKDYFAIKQQLIGVKNPKILKGVEGISSGINSNYLVDKYKLRSSEYDKSTGQAEKEKYQDLKDLVEFDSFIEEQKKEVIDYKFIEGLVSKIRTKTQIQQELRKNTLDLGEEKKWLSAQFWALNRKKADSNKHKEGNNYNEIGAKFVELEKGAIKNNDFSKLKAFFKEEFGESPSVIGFIRGVIKDKSWLEAKQEVEKDMNFATQRMDKISLCLTKEQQLTQELKQCEFYQLPVKARNIELEIDRISQNYDHSPALARLMKEKLYAEYFANDRKTIQTQDLEAEGKQLAGIVKTVNRKLDELTKNDISFDEAELLKYQDRALFNQLCPQAQWKEYNEKIKTMLAHNEFYKKENSFGKELMEHLILKDAALTNKIPDNEQYQSHLQASITNANLRVYKVTNNGQKSLEPLAKAEIMLEAQLYREDLNNNKILLQGPISEIMREAENIANISKSLDSHMLDHRYHHDLAATNASRNPNAPKPVMQQAVQRSKDIGDMEF